MASYVMLFHYTHQGIQKARQTESRTRRRAEENLQQALRQNKGFRRPAGLAPHSLFIVQDPYDETVAKLSLHVARAG